MSALESLLERLDGLRKGSSTGQWIARCPAHDDRSPSLSIREADDGKILVNCFAGCGAIDVLDALGLPWAALFPSKATSPDQRYFRPSSTRIPARDLLEVISTETSVVAMVAADMLANHTIGETDWQRLAKAAARIGRARDMVVPAKVGHRG